MTVARTIRFLAPTGGLLAALLTLHASAAWSGQRLWPNAVSGSASTAGNWSPAIVPTSADDASFQTAGNYTVSWASPQDTLAFLHAIGGTPAFSISSNLGVQNIFSLSVNGRATVAAGRVRANQVIVGGTGFGRLIVTGSTSQVVSRSANAATMFAETLSTSASLHVLAGSSFLSNSWMEFARKTASTCSVTVNGANLATGIGSKLGTMTTGAGQRGNMILSPFGTTKMDVSNGGVLDVKGHLVVGQRGYAVLREIDTTPLLDPLISVAGITFLGYDSGALTAGQGTLSIEGGKALFGGGFWLGDPDHTSGNGDFGKLIMRGGTAIVGGPIVMPTSLAGSIEMVGGTLQLVAGASTLRQPTPFNLSSGAGSPTLMVNGSANVTAERPSLSPFALGIGRGGAGRLRISGPAARFTSGYLTTIADSAGGTGVLEVDSSAVFTGTGDLYLGTGGQVSVANGGVLQLPSTPQSTTPGFHSSGAIVLNQGTITASSGIGTLDLPGSLTGSGTIQADWINHSSIVIPAAETLRVVGSLVQQGGTISGGGTLRMDGYLFESTGLVQASVVSAGTLIPYDQSPSNRPARLGVAVAGLRKTPSLPGRVSEIDPPLGHLHVTGDLLQSGPIQMRIGSQADGLRDTIEVDGAASVASVLYLDGLPGSRLPGDTVIVLTAASVSGAFTQVFIDGQDPGSSIQMLYTPTAIKLLYLGSGGVDEGPVGGAAPIELRLSARRSRGATALVLDLPKASHVRLALYDVGGREVARMVDGALAVGSHAFPCDASMASGMYFARAQIDTGNERIVRTARALVLR